MSKYLFLSLIAIRAITTSALPHLPNSTSSIENTYISQHMIKRGLLSPLTDLGNNLIGKGKPTFIILKKRNEKTRKKNNESVSFNTRAFLVSNLELNFFSIPQLNPIPDLTFILIMETSLESMMILWTVSQVFHSWVACVRGVFVRGYVLTICLRQKKRLSHLSVIDD